MEGLLGHFNFVFSALIKGWYKRYFYRYGESVFLDMIHYVIQGILYKDLGDCSHKLGKDT